MGWITPIAFLLCHTYSIGDAATLETFSSKSVLSPERGALTGHFRKYLETACPTYFAKRLIQQGVAGGFACRSNCHNRWSASKDEQIPENGLAAHPVSCSIVPSSELR